MKSTIFTALQALCSSLASSLLSFPSCTSWSMPQLSWPPFLPWVRGTSTRAAIVKGILPLEMISSSLFQVQVLAWTSLPHPGPHPNHISLVSPYIDDFTHFMVLISMCNLYLCYFCLMPILFTSLYFPLRHGPLIFCSKMYSQHGAWDFLVQLIGMNEWKALGLYIL